ncbi:bifunctional molybdenum cofactor biosynthesis protein MoaC/MoaB [Aegicerativicinus sediminis]|uniref:bifunctional molybdenum cofactor biosynthesis protein MoaC/MoaB n=1 Tax=Aegicerativicinus sediminis TaxID=2893202 RepID=UPI001E517E1B|nr:bifunctional molybdenum cofactor biosynthesis protein MoaC/MoaB [Aegicerativicinus sediminis]
MVDITHKYNTLRTAVAQSILKVSRQETIDAIKNGKVPKGDIFQMAKAAGLFAAKNTHFAIPDCHPLPIEYTDLQFQIDGFDLIVEVSVKTVYKTGVEVEAMHAASIAALTMYDMLKPIDKQTEITSVKLLSKKGGKSGISKTDISNLKAAVIVCSDTVSVGKAQDSSGAFIKSELEKFGLEVGDIIIIPDDKLTIHEALQSKLYDNQLLVFTGGTGLGPRDVTPDVLEPLIEKRLWGVEEAMRSYGQNRTPYAMLSRSLAGIISETVVLALPGSQKAVEECLAAILPQLFHIFDIMKGERH